jgi:hypothetical protein
MVHACGFVELEDRGFIEHDWNWLLDWLVVRQGLARLWRDESMGQLMLVAFLSVERYVPLKVPVGNNGVVSG